MVRDYFELAKPRIIVLLLITTAAAMVMAARGIPPLALTFWTLLGGALAAWLSLCGNVFYVGIYTMWLKRTTPLNIVIGGAAGAVPPLVGWAAVTHQIGGPALGLFALIFLWTPPHFWSLALMTETDYAKANIPMMPNVAGEERTKREIIYYTILLVAASLVLYPLHVMGAIYTAAAAVLGAIFLYDTIHTWKDAGTLWARRTFKYSLLYLALMCLVMVIDRIVA